MLWLGLIFIVLALLYFLLKVQVSYESEGGTIGMVPIMDGAVFPPLMATYGLVLLNFAKRVGQDDWVYWLFWLTTTLISFKILDYVGYLMERQIPTTPHEDEAEQQN